MEVRYFIKKKKGRKEGIVHFLFTLNQKKIKISTKQKIKVTEWGRGYPKQINSTSELRNSMGKWSFELNRFITSIIESEYRKPNREELKLKCKQLLGGIVSTNDELTLGSLVDKMISDQRSELKSGTIKYKINHLNHFLAIIGDNKTLEDFGLDSLNNYRKILITEGRESSRSRRRGTRSRY